MSTVTINLEDDVAAMLHRIHEPIEGAVREMIALELYRRGVLSSGKAAQLLDSPPTCGPRTRSWTQFETQFCP